MYEKVDKKVELISNCFILVLILYISYTLLTKHPPWVFLDNFNLAVHETGHFVFAAFGETMQFLGGTILQLAVPMMFLSYYFIKKQVSAIAFSICWLGDNLINIGGYMQDAIPMLKPLVGGGIHDWNWLFTTWGVLDKSESIGGFVESMGVLLLVGSVFILGYFIVRDFPKIIQK